MVFNGHHFILGLAILRVNELWQLLLLGLTVLERRPNSSINVQRLMLLGLALPVSRNGRGSVLRLLASGSNIITLLAVILGAALIALRIVIVQLSSFLA